MNLSRKSLFFSLSFVLVLAACGGGPSEDQQSTLVAVAVNAALTEAAAGDSAPAADTEAPIATEDAASLATPIPPTSPPPVVNPASTPVVVYQPAGLFSDADKAILQTRVIEPYIHYHADLVAHPPLVSLSLEPSDSLADYPFSANAIFEEGITNGFLIPATGGVVGWWVPDCLGPCPVSDSFRAAYPEIMAILEP